MAASLSDITYYGTGLALASGTLSDGTAVDLSRDPKTTKWVCSIPVTRFNDLTRLIHSFPHLHYDPDFVILEGDEPSSVLFAMDSLFRDASQKGLTR